MPIKIWELYLSYTSICQNSHSISYEQAFDLSVHISSSEHKKKKWTYVVKFLHLLVPKGPVICSYMLKHQSTILVPINLKRNWWSPSGLRLGYDPVLQSPALDIDRCL
jgi:hypothetical protein